MNPLHDQDVATSYAAWIEALREAGGLEPPESEVIDVALACGRVSAQAIVARRSSPAFDAAAMDGIAVAAAATAAAPLTLAPAAFTEVDTGDPLPPGTDAVVRSEDVVLAEGATLEYQVAPYANVRQIGEDVAAGDLLLPAGRQLGSADLAVVASAGAATIAVLRRPVVAILPSGDELVEPGADLRPGEIVETNSLMLAAMVEQAGGVAVRLPIVPDDEVLLTEALARAAEGSDLVLLLAGSARGAGDHAVAVIEQSGQVIVLGVAVKPGHPVVLGLTGTTPVIGVPGYPVSAAIAFELFAAPMLAELGGSPVVQRPRVRATAPVAIRSTARSDEWVRVRLVRIGDDLRALPLRRGAAVLSSLARADGLVCVPLGSSGIGAGADVEVELLRPLEAIERSLVVSGSTDPLLDELAARFELLADCDGSANGAASLVAGRCHLALVAMEDMPPAAAVLSTWERTLGLVVAPGDPLVIGGVEGLRRREVRLVNRQPGSAARRLLDELLAARSIDPAAVTGYHREARSHAAVVAAVAAGAADCAVCSLSACSGQPVELIPLATQTLVLAAGGGLVEDARLTGLRAVLGKGSPPAPALE
jgi:putative molybdopterin biosynthesis protein